jgi:phage baseplate assembly protein W|tara:strand:+ start:195 stop:638 length:444 start_codon:yes stop_codon:yes gene_type:complete
MAIKNISKKPFIEDRDDEIFIGIDLPFRKSNGVDGWFASSKTTIESVKNNIKNLLTTKRGERMFQPNLGMNFEQYLFEQFNDEIRIGIENDIVDTFSFWLPFVDIRDIQINMSENLTDIGKNTLNIFLTFNINRDPNTLESVQVEIT